ncbi:creatininase family protein [Paenibacillus nasutitermitis]|uniref:Creatinine amidohydrolase n=1 Tax=Paenibacillus nasutitermitis TaxID=1652958 RepID=A0A916Z6P8_9BACL|nr:creatininase family protein [Paenibacillus nasutitermitis]GGD76945.1 creatinine amidohydrolase [Paenibacillus nasutitermitis]
MTFMASMETTHGGYHFQHYTRERLNEFAREGGYVIVPLAATEQHGPHLPVNTDTMICDYVTRKSIERVAGRMPVLMAPILSIGCSEHHLSYGGTISYSAETYHRVLADVATSLVKDGFERIIFLNGHGGNHQIMTQVAQDTAVGHDVWTVAASYWNIANTALGGTDASGVGLVPGHAGGFETSLVMAICPELVDAGRIQSGHPVNSWARAEGYYMGRHGLITGRDGYSDSADQASAEKGQRYLDTIVGSVSDWLLELDKTIRKAEGGTE